MTLPTLRSSSFAAAIALAAFTTGAAAQVTPEQQSAIRGACRSDFMSKCSGVTPGGKEALQCLQTNVASLSPACKTAVSATIPPPAAPPRPLQTQTPPPAPAAPAPVAAPAAPAPAAPVAAPAAAPPAPSAAAPAAVRQVPPKPAQIAKPPVAAKQTAAPPPAAAAPAAPVATAVTAPAPTAEQMNAIKFTCRREFANNCRGVPAGGSEAIDCLQRNPGKLTPECKTSLAALGDARPASPGTPPPAPAGTPNAPIVMTAVIGRACLRDLALHCRDIKVGDGRKIACLMERGPALSPLCKAALKITEPVR
jgi:hypothetical protein